MEFYQKSLAITEIKAPDSLDVAASCHLLNSIGVVHDEQGELDQAMEYYQKSLAIREMKAPDSLDVAGSYNNI
jgi:tetratricopeptide (TPR) repeat protein